jgi:hypothetical protein
MAASDDDGAGAERAGAIARQGDGLEREPLAWQPPAIPRHRGRSIRDDDRLAGDRHLLLLDFAQVERQQLQPVRGVAEQIAFDQDVGDRVGLRGLHAHALQ